MLGARLLGKQTATHSIPLTDSWLESQIALRDFLDAIHGKDIFPMLSTYARGSRLAALFRKYDCPMWLDLCRDRTRLAIARKNETHNVYDMFKLSAALDDPLGCSEAIPLAAGRFWRENSPDNLARDKADTEHNVIGGSTMDIGCLGQKEMREIPLRYLGALMRASSKRGDTGGKATGGNWKAVADEFYRVLTMCV